MITPEEIFPPIQPLLTREQAILGIRLAVQEAVEEAANIADKNPISAYAKIRAHFKKAGYL